ncbi:MULTISPECIES: CPBP family intramembrane glutamic endopeptidase [Aequorivita]|uniref:CPBP family intramembrane metalloprotease n=1 Tax=Aequorivita iocasae TaxID=2803865 RepID=A0ABX7DR79_9FLAO|nr:MULTISPECIES: type II CAAX endopeptidase family protein [Aequorivita]QQX76302.1 CPBP family intramembrane metalloprotease [Aequorivita iocasae]UCA55765.1 CPBP family intramembrane metalloprotease [Aequorivita sp. F7]
MANLSNSANQTLKIALAFITLFILYHLAEYMIMFQNNVLGFFIFQVLFITAAWLFGKWYNKQGLKCWGLPFSKTILRNIGFGILLGVLLYSIPFTISLALGIEIVVSIPDATTLIKSSLPFAFGVIFSSFSEDILTRGLIYRYFRNKVSTLLLIIISATIYLLNHIYRLTDAPDTLLYLFLLGIIFIIPLVNTKNLWLTGSMHWAGNTFFFVSHNVVETKTGNDLISSNYLFSLCLILFIPIIWYLSKFTYLKDSKNTME